jgi:hypothetical protein
MSRWRWFAFVSVLVGCDGCASDDAEDDDAGDDTDDTDGAVDDCLAEPMTLTPGTGAAAYVALADGDPVTIMHGPQGGWHIETAGYVQHSVQALSLHPKVTAVALGLGLAGTELPDTTADPPEAGDLPEFKALAFYSDATCDGQFWGVRAFVDDVVTPPNGMTYQEFICSLENQELLLEITASDLANGRSVTSSVTVVAQLDPIVDEPVCP